MEILKNKLMTESDKLSPEPAPRYYCCWGCGVLHRGDSYENEESLKHFQKEHSQHKLQTFLATGREYWVTGSPLDPAYLYWVEVTNGDENFVVIEERKNVAERPSLKAITGRLKFVKFSVELGVEEIRSLLKKEAIFTMPSACKIELFIDLMKGLEAGMARQPLDLSQSHFLTDGSRLVGLGPQLRFELLDRCKAEFTGEDLANLEKFIEEHRQKPALSFRIKRHYQIDVKNDSSI